jgi:hypothetical protein
MIAARALGAVLGISVAAHACALDPEGLANTFDPNDGSLDGLAGAAGADDGAGGSAGDAGDAAAEAGDAATCGLYAQSCCVGSTPCQQGACLGGICRELGGVYVTNLAPECGNIPCAVGNPHASDLCACPPGFLTHTLPIYNDCWMPGFRTVADLTFCRASTAYAESDWAGAFQAVPPGTPCVPQPDGCTVPNPYTGQCACPPDTTAIALPVDVPTCSNTSHAQGTITLCWNATAPRASFDGAYLFDDAAPPCTTPNPATSDCSCPEPNPLQAVRMIRSPNVQPVGTTLYLCHPPV